jgi:hypothetical protein
MWSSWVNRKGRTLVMYIAKLKDSPKRVKKIFSMIFEGAFEMVRWRGRKWNHIKKKILKLNCFSPLGILTSLLFEETLGAFFLPLLFFLFLFSFSMLRLLGVLMIFEEENHFFKNFFSNKWYCHNYGYTCGGRIFWNRVMHANIAKP